MTRSSHPTRLTLPEGRYAVLADAAGTRIACADGALWITQYTDARDIVLHAGQSFVVDRDTKVIVSALETSIVSIAAPEKTPVLNFRQRLGRRLTGLEPCGPAALRLSPAP
jgi:hypothetical protein